MEGTQSECQWNGMWSSPLRRDRLRIGTVSVIQKLGEKLGFKQILYCVWRLSVYVSQCMCVGKKTNFGSLLSSSATGPGDQVPSSSQVGTTNCFNHWAISLAQKWFLKLEFIWKQILHKPVNWKFCFVVYQRIRYVVQWCQHCWWLKSILDEKANQGGANHQGSARSKGQLLSLSGRKFDSLHVSLLFGLEGPCNDILHRCSGWPFETHRVSGECHSF